MGSLLGTLLCASNTYFGLQVGWVTMGSLQSALLCWILFNVARKHYPLLPGLTVSEHVMVTTIATASATMPLAAGFVGIIPALRILQAKGYTSDPPLQRPFLAPCPLKAKTMMFIKPSLEKPRRFNDAARHLLVLRQMPKCHNNKLPT